MTEAKTASIQNNIPASPSAANRQGGQYQPYELNPDLARTKMAEDLIKQLGTPTIISKKFSVWAGINKSLLAAEIYDTGLRDTLYDHVAANSVNIDGKYFANLFAWLMTPKYVIQGMPMMTGTMEEEKESLLGRAVNWLRGGSKDDGTTNAKR